MIAKLSKVELFIYFFVWVFSYCFSNYVVYQLGNSFSTKPDYFVDGWAILQRKRDKTDYEWESWKKYSIVFAPWLIFHMFISEIIRCFYIEAIPLCYMLTTMSALLYHLPTIVSALMIIQLFSFFCAMLTSSKVVVWLLGIFYLLLISISENLFYLYSETMEFDQYYLTNVATAWFLLKCIDFALSEIKGDTKHWIRLFNLLAYTFYFPSFFFGPFIPYDYFKLQVYKVSPLRFKQRVLNLCFSIIRYFNYYLLFEFLTHFLYCNAMHFVIEKFISNGVWALGGMGLCMCTYFYLKYVVMYGFSTSICKFENLKAPDHPKCVFRIHLYSKMWRHFDRGFYLFMFRCIYSPICGKKTASMLKKLFASFICFSFVFIWHGGTVTTFYWCLFNFIGIVCEATCRRSWKNASIKKWMVSNISPKNLRRLEALLASPLWILAIISNITFFGGHDMGILYLEQQPLGIFVTMLVKWFQFENVVSNFQHSILLQYYKYLNTFPGSIFVCTSLIIISYCMCQVSIETDHFENKTHE